MRCGQRERGERERERGGERLKRNNKIIRIKKKKRYFKLVRKGILSTCFYIESQFHDKYLVLNDLKENSAICYIKSVTILYLMELKMHIFQFIKSILNHKMKSFHFRSRYKG